MNKAQDEHRSMPSHVVFHQFCRQAIFPPLSFQAKENSLTVGLLVPGAGTGTTELLGLASPVVGDEECAVVLDESLLELVLGVLVDVLLVVGDDGLGDGLADGVDLRGVTTTGDADADVDIGCVVLVTSSHFNMRLRVRTELVKAEDEDGLVDLEAQNLGLDKGKRLSVDLDETLTSLGVLRKYGVANARALVAVVCTLQWATAVAVFFLPKHCTD